MEFPNIKLPKKPNIDIPNMNIYQEQMKFDPLANYTPKSILVLGNGFDLDLGMKTSYRCFADSEEWPFDESNGYETDSLPYFLNQHKNDVNTWFDLEELLANYATQEIEQNDNEILNNIESLRILTESLGTYLQKQENIYIEKMCNMMGHTRPVSPSHCVLQMLLKKPEISVYSFNYTNAYRVANTMILNTPDVFNYVHGTIKGGDMVLGTGDTRCLNDEYFSFYKSASIHYKSSNLVEALSSADEVYIFGHSLGVNDHDYFSEFFKMATRERRGYPCLGKIKLRIFTLNDKSEIDIKKQLMTLTDKHLIGLYAHCDFKILKTAKEYSNIWMTNDSVF